MTSHRDQREAAVISKTEASPEDDRGGKPLGIVTIVVGLAGLVLGYLLGATGPATTHDAGNLDGEVTGLARSSEPDRPSGIPGPSAESSTSSTVAVTVVAAEPARILRERVPLLEGRQLVGVGDGEAFRWRAGSRQPEVIDLPSQAWAMWNDSGRHLAFVKYKPSSSPQATELWLSYLGHEPQPIWIGATTFAWHPTEDQISWIAASPAADTWQLMWGDVTAYGLENVGARDLGIAIDADQGWMYLAGFGDYGWVMTRDDWTNETFTSRFITIGPDGTETTDVSEDRFIWTVSPQGRILYFDQAGGESMWTDLSLEGHEPAGIDADRTTFLWIQSSGELLAFTDTDTSISAAITNLETGETANVPVPQGGFSPAVAPDGEVALTIAHEAPLETTVYVFELGATDVSVLRIPGAWWTVDISSR